MKEVAIKRRLLSENDEAAANLRKRFAEDRTLVLNLISSPGSGKTTLLEKTATSLARTLRLGAIEGDIATERDADRLRNLGIPARQIITGGACHLDARLVSAEMAKGGLEGLDVLFIENVGNLVCPTAYDLGEDFKIVLLSVTEGEDKPFKYPGIFARAAATLVTKVDLLPYVDFDMKAAEIQVRSLRSDALFLPLSARTGEGMQQWYGFLRERLEEKRRELRTED